MEAAMKANELGSELLGALLVLTASARELRHEARQSLPAAGLERLQESVNALNQAKAARPLRCPDAYIQQWQQVLAGSRDRLEPVAIPYLCWQPEIATDARFHRYLDRLRVPLRARALQGLVRSCHARWSAELAASSAVKAVRRRLERYEGANRLLCQWKSALTMILGPQGPYEVAVEMLAHLSPLTAFCQAWGVDEQSPYLLEVVRQAMEMCRAQIGRTATVRQYLLSELLAWNGWRLEDFKAESGALMLHPSALHMREALMHFVLHDHRLGDPRLPRHAENWDGIPAQACRRLLEWLAQADLIFFFDHVLGPRADPHGRKAFWLKYVPRLLRSRPLLQRDDAARLRGALAERGELSSHLGRIGGSTSAFLLDFGPLLVIEFSPPEDSCYVYERRVIDQVVPEFWMRQSFHVTQLKQSSICFDCIVYDQSWQEQLIEILDYFGIHPI
jgi:hypothetical protein